MGTPWFQSSEVTGPSLHAEARLPSTRSRWGCGEKPVDHGVAAGYVDGMTAGSDFEIFLVTAPGFESVLCAEAQAGGFKNPTAVKGGVTVTGGWPDVWRANLEIRGASHVFARIAAFRALHLAQLDKRSHKLAWGEFLRKDVPFRVEASCKHSRIYHQRAAAQRIENAIRDQLGAPLSPDAELC